MNTWFRKSLKHKLSVLLLISIMVPLLSLGFFTFKIASNITEENAKEAGMNSLEQLGSNLTLMFQDVENMSLFMIGQRDVQSFLNNDELQPVSSTRLIGFLSNLVFFQIVHFRYQHFPYRWKHPRIQFDDHEIGPAEGSWRF